MRVLLVEDERELAAAVRDGLVHEGIDVDVEHDGASGLWRGQHQTYDAIILDIMLPEMNGFVVCRSLRESEVWAPILMLTAKDGTYDEAEALDAGADDYLRKPFSFVVLLARLRALARRGTHPRPTVLTFGPLTLDPVRRQVSRGDAPVDLTRREFAVLELLFKAGGEPVPTEQILNHVWGFEAAPGSNVVQVNIRYLRQKLEVSGEAPIIETRRGVGYRLAVPDTTT